MLLKVLTETRQEMCCRMSFNVLLPTPRKSSYGEKTKNNCQVDETVCLKTSFESQGIMYTGCGECLRRDWIGRPDIQAMGSVSC